MVSEWKKQAMNGLTAVFSDRSAAQETAKASESLFECNCARQSPSYSRSLEMRSA
jgi:hypothetical protein